MKNKANINGINIQSALQILFMLFMCVYISIGHLTEYIDCFESNEIEQSGEKDIESEEKENKEEIEKDEFLSHVFLFDLINRQQIQLLHSVNNTWNDLDDDIPTPPPKNTIFCSLV